MSLQKFPIVYDVTSMKKVPLVNILICPSHTFTLVSIRGQFSRLPRVWHVLLRSNRPAVTFTQ